MGSRHQLYSRVPQALFTPAHQCLKKAQCAPREHAEGNDAKTAARPHDTIDGIDDEIHISILHRDVRSHEPQDLLGGTLLTPQEGRSDGNEQQDERKEGKESVVGEGGGPLLAIRLIVFNQGTPEDRSRDSEETADPRPRMAERFAHFPKPTENVQHVTTVQCLALELLAASLSPTCRKTPKSPRSRHRLLSRPQRKTRRNGSAAGCDSL